jgi:hypothetical protein
MVSGLDGSWDEPCVAAEFLWMGESVYLSDLGEDDHGAVITDFRDAGEQHRVVIVFTECLDVLCGLCLFVYQRLQDVQITGEAVLFGIRQGNTSEECHSSWAE